VTGGDGARAGVGAPTEVRDMWAVRVHAPGDLRVERVPIPVAGAGDALVRIRSVGVCTTDRKLAARGAPGSGPRILGHEIVGEVVAHVDDPGPGRRVAIAPNVGEGSCRWCREGATNYCPDFRAFGIHWDGGMAEYLVVPRDAVRRGHLIELPDDLPDERAALLEPLACCVEGLLTCGLQPGESLVVVGGGVMGRLHVTAARALGAGTIVLLDRSAARLAHARALGADVAIAANGDDPGAAVREALPGGADVVAVTVGDPAVVEGGLGWLATGGRLNVFAGLPAASTVRVDANTLHYRRQQLLGTTGASLPTLHRTLDMLRDPRTAVGGVVSAVVPLPRALDAFGAAGRPEHGRVLLVPPDREGGARAHA
jgi:L-iditol 2-dehydrogenase